MANIASSKFKPFWVEYGVQGELRQYLDHFIINLPAFEPGAILPPPVGSLDYRLGELTSYFTHFAFRIPPGGVGTAASVDEALARSTKDFCLFQNFGHIFYGAVSLSETIKADLQQCEFLTGHIMARGGYYYLHNQCFLVNRRRWHEIGRPSFGDVVEGTQRVAVASRSAENVHDDYTPRSLAPTGRSEDLTTTFGYGWNAISAGLAAGLPIHNWSDETRRHKRFCYAYYGRLQEWLDALNNVPNAPATQDRMLEEILAFLRNVPDKHESEKKIFLFNTEHDIDIPNLYVSRGVDRAFLLASGFKGNRILDKVGIGANTEVVIYDYSRPSLAFRRRMVETWDGRDFVGFAYAAVAALSAEFQTSIEVVPQEIFNDRAAMEREFQREVLDHFGNEDQWLAHWNAYRALPHHFEQVDLIGSPFDARKLMATHATGNCVMWISDMFDSPNAVGKFAHNYRITAYVEILRQARIYADSFCVIGGPDASWSWI